MVDTYSTRPELKSFIGIPENDETDDALAELALSGTSRAIDGYCGRHFYSDALPKTQVARTVTSRLWLDQDCHTITLVEANTGGTYATRAATSYEAGPLNGVHHGLTGWPVLYLDAVGTAWPSATGVAESGLVRVTATCGWVSVPVPVRQACLLLAAERFKLKDAPFGVAGFGDYTIRVRDNPIALGLLEPYRRVRRAMFA